MAARELIACHGCDLLQKRLRLNKGEVASCLRCGTPLYRYRPDRIDTPLALTLAGLLFFLVAVSTPFLSLSIEGRQQETLLVSGGKILFQQGFPAIAVLAVFTGVLAPLLQLCGTAFVLICLKCKRVSGPVGTIYRWVRHLQVWSMAEVYLLGILVAAVKLVEIADLQPGWGMYAFTAGIFLTVAATAVLNPDSIWEKLPVKTKS
jgi:paraquat-inducible protein A